MRFRYSRSARQRLTKARNKKPSFPYARLGTAAFVLLVFATWILLYENQARTVVDRLLDRTAPGGSPEYARTAAGKSDQQIYHRMDTAVYSALINLQVTPDRIRDTKPRMPTGADQWTPVERHVTVSGAYSLTECNLEIVRAVTRAGGTVVHAAERVVSGDLLLEIGDNGKVTHHLQVNRASGLQRKTARLAVVIAYTDENNRGVVEALAKLSRPITFALPGWAADATGLAGNLSAGGHEVIALLPVQPKSFTRHMPRRRSVLPTHSETTNRRITQAALASFPSAGGVLAYPGFRMDDEAELLVPLIDELGKRDKFLLEIPRNETPTDGLADPDSGPVRVRAWGILDRLYNPVIISMNLDRASFSALSDAPEIVVAAARPHTLQVLMNQMARLELRGIEFVRLSDLLEH